MFFYVNMVKSCNNSLFYFFISFQQCFSELVREFGEGGPHLGVRVPAVGHHPVQVLRRVVGLAHPHTGWNFCLKNNNKVFYMCEQVEFLSEKEQQCFLVLQACRFAAKIFLDKTDKNQRQFEINDRLVCSLLFP